MSLSLVKRPLPADQTLRAYRQPRGFREYQRSVQSNATLLAGQYPQASLASLKRLLEQLQNDMDTAAEVLAKQRKQELLPPNTALTLTAQITQYQQIKKFNDPLLQKVINDPMRARHHLAALMREHPSARTIGQLLQRQSQMSEQNSLLKRAFYRLLLRQKDGQERVRHYREKVAEARQLRSQLEGRIRELHLSRWMASRWFCADREDRVF